MTSADARDNRARANGHKDALYGSVTRAGVSQIVAASLVALGLLWLIVVVLWLVFVTAEFVWFHATGHPFWPVVCPC